MGFEDSLDVVGYGILVLFFVNLISYLAVGYFNLYVLIPRLLFRERYVIYIICFVVSILTLQFLSYGMEHYVHIYYNLSPGLYSLDNPDFILSLDFISAFVADTLCIGGCTMTIVFVRRWMIDSEYVGQLEKKQLQSEIDQMKEQVNPLFLFETLHRMGELTSHDQQKASDMLMETSELLRYQLYDCSRDKVLLDAEIAFLTNYLILQKVCHGDLDYRISTTGKIRGIFIPPLLFLPFIQEAVTDLRKEGTDIMLLIVFESVAQSVLFSCNCKSADLLVSSSLLNLRNRLERLFPGRYNLTIEAGEKGNNHVIHLQLDM